MLTAKQIEARRGKLTASRIKVLMTGDADGILRLYREMIGDEAEEDLSAVWPVRLGEATEALNVEWYERKHGKGTLTRQGEVIIHPRYKWAAATLDGWDATLHCPVEMKHVGGREPMETIIERYQPQMQFQMLLTDAKQCALSVIMGANEPVVEYIPRDDAYIAEMIKRAKQFMVCVTTLTPPVELAPVPPPVKAELVYDMSEHEAWRARALQWLQTRGAADTAKECEKALKAMVPEDAAKCHGVGVRITRDRAGRLSLREDK